MMTVALICGGPSGERGISLNSARCFLDHAQALGLHLLPIYLSPKGEYYLLQSSHLYSNTPSDFDFKLAAIGKRLEERDLIAELKKIDLVFPLIHGVFGEDGHLQQFLEKHHIPFVGSPSKVCKEAFNKILARRKLERFGFEVLPWQDADGDLESFWREQCQDAAIVKPAESGSSIGVTLVQSLEEAKEAVQSLHQRGFAECLIEPFCKEAEFTVCVLETEQGKAVSLIPLEIAIEEGIFDYRRKYLPTDGTRYYCPPRFSSKTIQEIRTQAERLFTGFGLRDVARIDGFLLKDGSIRFSDFNLISGMEQNSFLFQQAARVGMTHPDLISYLLQTALARHGKKISLKAKSCEGGEHPVFVMMGGNTSERQVSLMSGTNVWLKLQSTKRKASLFLLEKDQTVWELPYAYSLHHTVEEMAENCRMAEGIQKKTEPLVQRIREQLHLEPLANLSAPRLMSLNDFLDKAKRSNAFVFLGLHGGEGEDGTLQERFETMNIPFNGSGSSTSKICMDKYKTAQRIKALNDSMVLPMPQISFHCKERSAEALWEEALFRFGTEELLIKPQCDGCSTGVVRLHSLNDLRIYLDCSKRNMRSLPAGTLQGQKSDVELPLSEGRFLLEPFIVTDRIEIRGVSLEREWISGWCEMTIAVLERDGVYRALHPSITVAEHYVLSLEEKFQGGTGINITPPPEEILSSFSRKQAMAGAERVACALGIQNYARLDLFVEYSTGRIRVIEANSLPALTPSTVFYHQALSVNPPLPPRELILHLIDSAKSRFVN